MPNLLEVTSISVGPGPSGPGTEFIVVVERGHDSNCLALDAIVGTRRIVAPLGTVTAPTASGTIPAGELSNDSVDLCSCVCKLVGEAAGLTEDILADFS